METNFEPAVPLDQDLNATLGFQLGEISDEQITGWFEVENRVRQPFGIVHGGTYAALAESLASIGTYAAVGGDGKIAMGMSNDTSFLRAVREGRVDATARPIHRGRTTWVWEVEMRDPQQRLCAVSRVTIAVREARA